VVWKFKNVAVAQETDEGKAIAEAARQEFHKAEAHRQAAWLAYQEGRPIPAPVVETAPLEVVVVEPEPELTEAHLLLAKVVGKETASLATEAEAISLLQTAIASGQSLVYEDEIVDYLAQLMETAAEKHDAMGPWPTEPRVGEIVPVSGESLSSLLYSAGGYSFEIDECEVLWGKYEGVIEVERPFDAIAMPEKEETMITDRVLDDFEAGGVARLRQARIEAESRAKHVDAIPIKEETVDNASIVEKVAAIAAEVKAERKAAKATKVLDGYPRNILRGLYKDEDGRYYAPKGSTFRLVHQLSGLVNEFKTLRAVKAS
jgi:hypothetical protein